MTNVDSITVQDICLVNLLIAAAQERREGFEVVEDFTAGDASNLEDTYVLVSLVKTEGDDFYVVVRGGNNISDEVRFFAADEDEARDHYRELRRDHDAVLTQKQRDFADSGLREALDDALRTNSLIKTAETAAGWHEFFQANLVRIPGSPFSTSDLDDEDKYEELAERADDILGELESGGDYFNEEHPTTTSIRKLQRVGALGEHSHGYTHRDVLFAAAALALRSKPSLTPGGLYDLLFEESDMSMAAALNEINADESDWREFYADAENAASTF